MYIKYISTKQNSNNNKNLKEAKGEKCVTREEQR